MQLLTFNPTRPRARQAPVPPSPSRSVYQPFFDKLEMLGRHDPRVLVVLEAVVDRFVAELGDVEQGGAS